MFSGTDRFFWNTLSPSCTSCTQGTCYFLPESSVEWSSFDKEEAASEGLSDDALSVYHYKFLLLTKYRSLDTSK